MKPAIMLLGIKIKVIKLIQGINQMKKLFFLVITFFGYSLSAMQKENTISGYQSESHIDEGSPVKLSIDHISELIKQKKYGPELAGHLDAFFNHQGYAYDGNGFYSHEQKPRICNFPRQLCEQQATIAQVEAMNKLMGFPGL
jgi:hypothetical protein